MQSAQLIAAAIDNTKAIIAKVERLKQHELIDLTCRPNATSWSVLECLEHLNLYGDFYLPKIKSGIDSSTSKPSATFKSGILGAYFSKIMLPKEKLNTMKAPKDKNPIHSTLDRSVIDRFLQQQHQLLNLLNKAQTVDLEKVKITTSISNLIKLKLGDTFNFLINHNIRHLAQAEKIIAAQPMSLAACTA